MLFKGVQGDVGFRIGRKIMDLKNQDYKCYKNSIRISFKIENPELQKTYSTYNKNSQIENYMPGATYLSVSGD